MMASCKMEIKSQSERMKEVLTLSLITWMAKKKYVNKLELKNLPFEPNKLLDPVKKENTSTKYRSLII